MTRLEDECERLTTELRRAHEDVAKLAEMRDAATAKVVQMADKLRFLADDLAKAEDRHFSLGLMRIRIKAIRAALDADE